MRYIVKKISFVFLSLCIIGTMGVIGITSAVSPASSIEKHDIVIVGGGISGLTCGYYLKNSDVVILEKKGKVGGRTVSGVHNAFTYAKGTEYLGEPEVALSQMIKALKLTPREIPSPMDATFDGKSFFYGSEGLRRHVVTKSDTASYAKFKKLIINKHKKYEEVPVLEYTQEEKTLDNMTAKAWLIANKIPKVFIDKYNVSSKGLFGATLDEISALSFIPEAAFDFSEKGESQSDTTKETYLSYDEEDIQEEYADALTDASGSYSFSKGITELTDEIAKHLGKKVRVNSCVLNVTKKGNAYQVTYLENNGLKKVILAKKVVLSVSAPEALKIAPSLLNKEKTALMQSVKYSSYATVALFSDQPIFDKAFDLALPDDYFFTDLYDATWVERYYDKSKDVKDYIATAYVAPQSYKDHSIDTMSDTALMSKIKQDLERVIPGASQRITGYDIERFIYAYPIMTPGAYNRLLRLNELNSGNLILAGDYMVYPTFEAAVQSGYLAAKQIGIKK